MSADGMNRREFVRAAAGGVMASAAVGGVVGSAAGSLLPRAGWGGRHGADRIRVGLIGCGGRGTGAALQAVSADSGAVLVAVGDIFGDRVKACLEGLEKELGEKAKEKLDVPPERRFVGFDAYQKVIDAGVDVVLLTSYPNFRPMHLKAAIAAGKHVFAEKPLAVDAPGLRSVMESAKAAKEKNLGLLVGFCWRYNDGMRATFERVNGGMLGDIMAVHTDYHTTTLSRRPRQPGWSEMEFQMRNWWHFTWLSGDHIVEQAIHSVDRLSWSLGDKLPLRVTCLGGRAARSGEEHGNVFDHFAAIYEYEGGTRHFHTCRQIDGCPSDNTDYIYGTKGSCTVNGWVPTYHMKDRSGATMWKYSGPEIRDMYQVEHDEFFKSIRDGKPINDCERGANSTMMAIMARMAAYTGQTVSWKQAWESQEDLSPAKMELGDAPAPVVAVPGKTKFV